LAQQGENSVIVKIAGCSGSGKSTFVRAAFSLWDFEEQREGKKIREYVARIQPGERLFGLFNQVVVLGDYSKPCGGMDGVSDVNERYERVAAYTGAKFRKTLVFCEGLLFMVYQREGLGKLSEDKRSGLWVYGFMDTPLSLCLERVRQRRLERGVVLPMNPKNTTGKHQQAINVKLLVEAAGAPNCATYMISHKLKPLAAMKAFCKFLEKNYGI